MNLTCFTIGYEKKSFKDFLYLLESKRIEALVDVREFAFSRRPEFRKSPLEKALKTRGIEYIHLKALGSTKELRENLYSTLNYKAFFKEYENILKKNSSTLEDLLAIIVSGKRICLMCYEREHEKCHRLVLSNALIDLNNNGLRIEPIS
jgi:uncharacterized protein (DUF488 family)